MNGLRILPVLIVSLLLCQCAGSKITPVKGTDEADGLSFKSGGDDDNQFQMTGVMGAAVTFGNQPRFDSTRHQ